MRCNVTSIVTNDIERLSRASPAFRAFAGLLALALAAGAIFPQLALLPLRSQILASRTPQVASEAARLLLGTAALVFGLIAIFWRRFLETAVASVTWTLQLSSASFWSLVIGSGCALRALVGLALPRPFPAVADAAWYREAAGALAAGEGLSVGGGLTAYRPPLYPLLLSLTGRVGAGDGSIWLWGGLSIFVIIWAMHRIANRLYGPPVARLTVLTLAIYPALALQTGQAMSDLLFLAGSLVFAMLLFRDRSDVSLSAAVVGIVLALLALTRGVALGLIAVPPIVWLTRRIAFGRVAVAFVVMVVTWSLCLSPWVTRNYFLFGHAVLGTNFGVNAFIGNHEGATGGYDATQGALVPDAAGLNEADADRLFLRQTLAFIGSHPVAAASILPGKLMHLYLLETSAVTGLFQGDHHYPLWAKYGLYGISQLCYLAVLALFGARAFQISTRATRPRGLGWTPWIFISYFTLVTLAFFGQDRFRLPILPWMVMEACVLLTGAAGARGVPENWSACRGCC